MNLIDQDGKNGASPEGGSEAAAAERSDKGSEAEGSGSDEDAPEMASEGGKGSKEDGSKEGSDDDAGSDAKGSDDQTPDGDMSGEGSGSEAEGLESQKTEDLQPADSQMEGSVTKSVSSPKSRKSTFKAFTALDLKAMVKQMKPIDKLEFPGLSSYTLRGKVSPKVLAGLGKNKKKLTDMEKLDVVRKEALISIYKFYAR